MPVQTVREDSTVGPGKCGKVAEYEGRCNHATGIFCFGWRCGSMTVEVNQVGAPKKEFYDKVDGTFSQLHVCN